MQRSALIYQSIHICTLICIHLTLKSRPMKLTPMLEQYFEIKRQVPDAILFYRLGDFYEMFFEDAEKAAPLLDLVLTARNKGQEHEAPMCGVPYHSADGYIAKLIRHGLRVAICDQTEDAGGGERAGASARSCASSRRARRRRVSSSSGRVVTLAVGRCSDDTDTASAPPTSTSPPATFSSPRTSAPTIRGWPTTSPASRRARRSFRARRAFRLEIPSTAVEPSLFETAGAHDYLSQHFGTQSLRGFGLEGDDPRIGAAGAALRYAAASHKRPLDHVLVAARRQRSRLSPARRRHARQPGDPRLARRHPSARVALERRQRHALGHGRRGCCASGSRVRSKSRDAIFDRHDAVDELTRSRAILEADDAAARRRSPISNGWPRASRCAAPRRANASRWPTRC